MTSSEAAGAVNSSLLIVGSSALVIDAQYTRSGARAVIAALEEEGASATRILISHAHPDHYFGARTLIEAFPDAVVLAAPEVATVVRETAAEKVEQQSARLGEEFPGEPVMPTPLEGDSFDFEGTEVRVLTGLSGDTEPVTGFYIPSLSTLVASDVAFSGTHVWTADSTVESRARWRSQLDELAAMRGLETVIPGHQAPDADHSPAVLSYTRDYLTAFDESAAAADASGPLIAAMQGRYPDAIGAFFLSLGAQVATGELEW